MAKIIGTLGNIDTLTIGTATFVDPANSGLITLLGYTTTTGNRSSMRKPGQTSGYAVTTAKTLTIRAMLLRPGPAALDPAGTQVEIGKLHYSDNDLGMNTATASTNPVYLNTVNQTGQLSHGAASADRGAMVPSNVMYPMFPIPAAKFFGYEAIGVFQMNAEAYGYEA